MSLVCTDACGSSEPETSSDICHLPALLPKASPPPLGVYTARSPNSCLCCYLMEWDASHVCSTSSLLRIAQANVSQHADS